jgi:AGCS family alanine or glycine:cation symporter
MELSVCLFCLEQKNKKYYNYIYILSIIIGATTSLSLMINLIDSFFALMAIPTMLATLLLSPKVIVALKKYNKFK